MILTITILTADALLLLAAALFTYESIKEQEPRAPKVGFGMMATALILAALILFAPALHWPIAVLFGLMLLTAIIFILPGKSGSAASTGSSGYIVGQVGRTDERDIVFARNRSLPPGSEVYRRYYEAHPELEERDSKRRAMGGPVGSPGSIDQGYRPNVSMIATAFSMPPIFGPYAEPNASQNQCGIDPDTASEIVKGLAIHLGAAQVGICKVDSRWAYSHRGEIFYNNWDDWGKELPEPLPYAIVIATEMDAENVSTGPHTPAVVESGINYAKGAYITTFLARWFAEMGFKAYADHSRHYRSIMPPLAVDAGLGQVGRFGYLITGKHGPRARLFAAATDMPLTHLRQLKK